MRNRTLPSPGRWLLVALISGFCLALTACTEELPLKIGFIGGLTGRNADLGIAGRDAVTLAVEERNQSGGIAGRQILLVVKDDRQDQASATQAIEELLTEEVVAIIGPMTSAVAMVVKPLIDAAGVVTISPTAKTDQLNGLDDFFLRVITPLSRNARQMASHAVQNLQLKKIAVVYDASNLAFTATWLEHFRVALEEHGGRVVMVEEFTSQPDAFFLPIAQRVLQAEPEAVLLLSNAIDTAMLAQQIRKLQSPVALFASEWAFTSDLIGFGGRAVNGMTAFHGFHADSQEARYLDFKERFTRRFGYAPSFATVHAYDAATCLFNALTKNPGRDGLKQALLTSGSVPGLQKDILFDPYGDVEAQLFLTRVEEGRFRVVESR